MTKQNQPADLVRVIAQRRALGIDRYDEVWQGEYRIVAAPHPERAYLDNVLVRVLTPYAQAAGLVGLTSFNLGQRTDYRVPDDGYRVTFYVLDGDHYTEVERSPLLGVSADEITAAIDRPLEPS